MDVQGKSFQQLGADERQVVLRMPIGVAVDRQDNIYVGDNNLHVIMQFGPDLQYVRMLGDPGDVSGPSGLAVDPTGRRLYAVDTQSHQIVVYDLASGKVVARVGKKGVGPGEFGFPGGIAVGADGRVYVSDTMNYRVQVFDPDLKFMTSFGRLGDTPGDFRRPKGIAIDGEGIIYVIDSDFNNFQMFNPEGQVLLAVGEYGMRPGQMMLPAGIAVHPSSRRIFVADQLNRRVQAFERVGPRLGQK
jgi:DNA-binding beta-propeller fold protein YncE